jgi:aspartate dehydrogenase
MATVTIGLVGGGTVGGFIARALAADPRFTISYVLVRDADKARAQLPGAPITTDIGRAMETQVDLVVEAATADIAKPLLPAVLAHSNVLPFTLTVLSDAEVEKTVLDTCATSGKRLFVPHGALVGLDGIAAGRDVLSAVTIKTTKTPKSLGLKNDEVGEVYNGPTRGACQRFSRNSNVHAAVALSGLGFDRTRSIIVADPSATTMSHVVSVEGDGLAWSIEVKSVPVGAVTGAFTPLSALSSVRRCTIGGTGIVMA